jgi:hypothetical protein
MKAHTTFNHNKRKSSKPGVKLLTPNGNGHASTRPVAIIGHAWRAHVAHSAGQGEMGRHGWMTTPTRGTSGKQDHDAELSPSPSTSRHGDVSVLIYRAGKIHCRRGRVAQL